MRNANIKLLSSAILVLGVFIFGGMLSSKNALATSFQMSGKVSDSSGSGISGATVDIIDTASNTEVATVITDNDGNYGTSVNGGNYNIQVSPPVGSGFGTAIAPSYTISGNSTVNFILAPAGSVIVSGQIFDEFGDPLPSQGVTLVDDSTGSQTSDLTDNSGSYSIPVLSGTYSVQLSGSADLLQKAPHVYQVSTSSHSFTESTTLNFTLPEKQIVAHVQDSSGNPLENIKVRTSFATGASNLSLDNILTITGANSRYDPGTDVTTDASGNATLFLFPNDPNSTYSFIVTPPADSGFSNTTFSGVNITEDSQKTFTLGQTVTVSGQVFDEFGDPLPSQGVTLVNDSTGSQSSGLTDNSGTYSIQIVPGVYSVQLSGSADFAQKAPHVYQVSTSTQSFTQDVTLNFALPEKRIIVHMQDGLGNVLANCKVRTSFATGASNLSLGNSLTVAGASSRYDPGTDVTTDTSGNATLYLFPNDPNSPYSFIVTPTVESGFPNTTFSNINVTVDAQETLTLQQPIVVAGHVLDELGNPLPDQGVTLVNDSTGSQSSAITDSSGVYSIRIQSGNYHFRLSGNQNPSLNAPTIYQVDSNSQSFVQNASVDLTLPEKKVSVHVEDSFGNPISNVNISTSSSSIATGASIGNGFTVVGGISSAVNHTDAAGNANLWLFPNSSGDTYTFVITPPAGSIYSKLTLNNIAVASDQSEVVSLQFVHEGPATTADLFPVANQQGDYSDPTAVTLSATAAAGFTIANTYYTIDGGPQQIYSTPFSVSGGGSHTITYRSIDNVGVPEAPNSQTFTIAPLVITTVSLPATTVSASYSQTLQVTGGAAPLSWSVSAGSLPAGLSLNSSTGAVSGTSTSAGTYNFTVQTADANSQIDTQALTIVVNSAPTITTTALPNATVSGPYSQSLSSTGGTSPKSWTLVSGTLSSGVTLSSSGMLSGTPTAAGTSSFTIRVTDTNGVSASQALSLLVNPAPTITRTNLPDIKVNHSYSQTVTASGGTAPLTWNISAGSLPTGLSLNLSNGLISGTPTMVATYNFTVRVTDANNVGTTQALSIKVKP